MSAGERKTYLAGVVDGLRQARWMKDKPDPKSSKCISDWYYQSAHRSGGQIAKLMLRNPSKPAQSIIFVLIRKECGW